MQKTIFDYESSSDEEEKISGKRTYNQFMNKFDNNFDQYLFDKKSMIQDIEKHCRNKRLKKNIYKMDCVKLVMQPAPSDQVYNPGVTAASSDYEKLPRAAVNDPVIDAQFKKKNESLLNSIMKNESTSMLFEKGLNPQNVFESDFCKTTKLADFDEYIASRRTSSSSPTIGA